MQDMKITKKQYILAFFTIVAVLAIIRCTSPKIAEGGNKEEMMPGDTLATPTATALADDVEKGVKAEIRFFDEKGNIVKNRIYSVPRFCDAFPDSNNVQLASAKEHGVKPVLNRADAEKRHKELVYIGANPFFCVDKLKRSTPYLVPRAANLLGDIGQSFMDSLAIKGIPLHKCIVTSVLRTREDVERLRTTNRNATENSCHLYGTTFDICYNRYTRVNDPEGKQMKATGNDTLKWVLSEVLRDMRVANRCYIKYEVKQGCFHITVR